MPAAQSDWILVGASNVANGERHWLGALEAEGSAVVSCAHGHGRSYGMHSSVFGRRLPGILQCGLWEHLAQRKDHSLQALVTDVGNDLLYGVPPEVLLGWVERVLDRLTELDAAITLTGLPAQSIERLGPVSFGFWTRLLFPGRRLSLEGLLAASAEVDAGLERLAEERALRWLRPPREWYGLDPIHIRRGVRKEAWGVLLGLPSQDAEGARIRPARRWLLGREQRYEQPCVVTPGGLAVHAY